VARLPPIIYRAAFQADARLNRGIRSIKRRLGVHRPYRIAAYRGFGTAKRACIKARILEDRGYPQRNQSRGLLGAATASFQRYYTVETPGARVRVRWAGEEWEAVADDEGFVELWIRPPTGLAAGWHTVSIRLLRPDDGHPLPVVEAPVLLVDAKSEYGVITDVDDTIIVTGVSNLLRRAWTLFMTEARTRLPFEGVSAFYDALRQGRGSGAENPVFYVSSTPWNLYEHLDHFFEVHDLPRGPILLRDWGLRRDGFAPGGGHGHKREKIRTVLNCFPDLRFILIGDSGQEDAEHYLSIVREEGARILAVYIRSVHSGPERDARLQHIADEMRVAGSSMVLVESTVEAARHAAEQGYIGPLEVDQVRQRKDEDHQDPSW